MNYSHQDIAAVAELLASRLETLEQPRDIFKSIELRALYDTIKNLPPENRAAFGAEVNKLKTSLESTVVAREASVSMQQLPPIDITAPFDINIEQAQRAKPLPSRLGSIHPLTNELKIITDIYAKMGFEVVESRELDDDFHMFESLNFLEGHPARDDYDTFMTDEGLIAPAHTSTMQHRVLKMRKNNLTSGLPISAVIPGRVFRNEDIDATHEHTFYQIEGVYVDRNINVGNLIAVLRSFMSEYFGQNLKAKLQPFYFPFTEPSFESAIERPAALRKGESEADMWLELLGCGMIHPNVLEMAGIDNTVYTGFAWGNGIERLVMTKYGIEDIRHFEAAKLEFLRQFSI